MYFVKFGEGDPIVFLHGWGCDGSIFLPIAQRLQKHTNYLIDFKGFGKSDLPPFDGWTVNDYAADLFDFFSQNALSNVTIVGHSFGCRVAMVLAAEHPELVARMLFASPAGLRRFSLKRWWRVRLYKLRKLFGVVNYGNAAEDYINSGQLKNTFVKVVNEDLSDYAIRIRCPVLIVNGRDDSTTPLRHAQKLCKLIPNGNLTVIDGDHFAFFRSPVAFAETIKTFAEQ